MPTSPIAPLSQLMKRLNDEARKQGLLLVGFEVMPNYVETGPHGAQAVFVADPDFNKVEPVSDPEFDALVKAQEDHEREEAANKARESLASLRDSLGDPSKGLGFD